MFYSSVIIYVDIKGKTSYSSYEQLNWNQKNYQIFLTLENSKILDKSNLKLYLLITYIYDKADSRNLIINLQNRFFNLEKKSLHIELKWKYWLKIAYFFNNKDIPSVLNTSKISLVSW